MIRSNSCKVHRVSETSRVPTVSVTPIARKRIKVHFSVARFSLKPKTLNCRNYPRPSRIRSAGADLDRRSSIQGGEGKGVLEYSHTPAASGAGETRKFYLGILTEMGYAHRPRLADEGAPAFTWRGCTFFTVNTSGYTQAAHDVSLRIMMIDGDWQSRE